MHFDDPNKHRRSREHLRRNSSGAIFVEISFKKLKKNDNLYKHVYNFFNSFQDVEKLLLILLDFAFLTFDM